MTTVNGKLKIAYVLKKFPRLSETFILNEILELERRGVDLHIFSLKNPPKEEMHHRIREVRAPITYLPRHSHGRASLTESSGLARDRWQNLLRAETIAQLLAGKGFDHIHAHFGTSAAEVAMEVSRRTGIPYSVTLHAKDIFHNSVDRQMLQEKIRNAAVVITVSNFNVNYLRRKFPHVNSSHIERLYNGLDLDLFSSDGQTRREERSILSVGRLVEKKGYRYLVEALAILRDWGEHFACRIVGEGDLQGALESQIRQSGLEGQVQLTGPKPQEELLEEMRKATVLALPCIIGADGDRDALPTVLLEAMATGLPVISTRITGIPEIISHKKTGLLVPQKDALRLAGALRRLLRDHDLRQALALQARKSIERDFDIRRNVARLLELFIQSSLQSGKRSEESLGGVQG